jgi:hypothetical protein
MYERGGFMITDDGALVMLAGSTLGGGELSHQTTGGSVAARCAAETACTPASRACWLGGPSVVCAALKKAAADPLHLLLPTTVVWLCSTEWQCRHLMPLGRAGVSGSRLPPRLLLLSQAPRSTGQQASSPQHMCARSGRQPPTA